MALKKQRMDYGSQSSDEDVGDFYSQSPVRETASFQQVGTDARSSRDIESSRQLFVREGGIESSRREARDIQSSRQLSVREGGMPRGPGMSSGAGMPRGPGFYEELPVSQESTFGLQPSQASTVPSQAYFSASEEPELEPKIGYFVHVAPNKESEFDVVDNIRLHFVEAHGALKRAYDNLTDESGGWRWLADDAKIGGETSNIVFILAMIFGVFSKVCFGEYKNGTFIPAELFLPEKMLSGGINDVCKGTFFFYRSTQNGSVYCKSKMSLFSLIHLFVKFIKDLGYFTLGNPEEFAPSKLYAMAATKIAMSLCGSPNQLTIDPSDDTDGFYTSGIRNLNSINKDLWAMDGCVLYIPLPRQQQWWEEHVYLKKEDVPQISLQSCDFDGIPNIPLTRHFQLDDQEEFNVLLGAVNKYIMNFVERKMEGLDDEELQQLICNNCVDLLHKYTPNFMSFIGAQYLQRICIKQQGVEYENMDIDKPRSYYSLNGDYEKDITAGEKKIIGSFVEVFGSLFFASHTYVCAFIGEPGCGKNYIRRIATKIAGGKDVVFIIDDRFNNFSLQSYAISKPFLGVVEDAGNKQTDIPRMFKDSALGVARDTPDKECIKIDVKFHAPIQVC